MQFTKNRSLAAKGSAVLLLLFYHLFESAELVENMGVIYAPFSLQDFLMLTGFGNICVAVFVFLTSYGIAKGLFETEADAKTAYAQAVRRFFKLMANFFVLYISVNLLWFTKFDYKSLYGEGMQGLLYMLTDATGLSMFFKTPNLNMTWWYMELAYILIFLIPFLTWLVKKIGYPVMLLAFLAPAVITFNPDVKRYLLTAVAGVCAAYGGWFEKLSKKAGKLWLQWLVAVGGLALCVLIRQNYAVHTQYLWVADAPIAMFIVWVSGGLCGSVPVLSKILQFIGKHSMNIYMVHTFFYMILWQKEIYRFHYAGLIYGVLLAVSLLYSVVLEAIKRLVITGSKKLPMEKWQKVQ